MAPLSTGLDFTIDAPVSVPSTTWKGGVSIAYDGVTGKHLVVWEDGRDRPDGTVILGRRLTPLGLAVPAVPYLVSTGLNAQSLPKVTFASGVFRLALLTDDAPGHHAFYADLDSSLFATPLRSLYPSPRLLEPKSLATNGNSWLMTWEDATEDSVGYSVIDFDGGVLVAAQRLSGAGQFFPSIGAAAAGPNYLVAWDESNPSARGWVTRVSPDGVALDLASPIQIQSGNDPYGMAVARRGPDDWVVAWEEDVVGDTVVRGARVRGDGGLFDAQPLDLFDDSAGADYEAQALGLSSGDVQLAAIENAGVVVRRLFLDGGTGPTSVAAASMQTEFESLAGASHGDGVCLGWTVDQVRVRAACQSGAGAWLATDLADTTNEQRLPSLTFLGPFWSLLWTDDRGGPFLVRQQTMGLDGTPIGPSVELTPGRVFDQVAPSAAAVGTQQLITWSEVPRDGGATEARYLAFSSGVSGPSGGAALDSTGQPTVGPTVADTDAGFLTAWRRRAVSGDFELIVSPRNLDGSPRAEHAIGSYTLVGAVALACHSGLCLLVIEDRAARTIAVQRFDLNGSAVDLVPTTIATGNNDRYSVAIAWGANQFYVVWVDEDPGKLLLYGRQVFPDLGLGPIVTLSNDVAGVRAQAAQAPRVVFDGDAFTTLFSASVDLSSRDLYLVRVGLDGGLVQPRTVLSGRRENERYPALASDGRGRTLGAWERLSMETPEASVRLRLRFLNTLEVGLTCFGNSDCKSGFCVDGVCCSSACTNGCEACAVVRGASVDGTCGVASAGLVCRAAVDVCDLAEVCAGQSACPPDLRVPQCTAPSCDGGAACDAGAGGGTGGTGGGGAGGSGGRGPVDLRVGCGCTSPGGTALALLVMCFLALRRAAAG